MQTLSNRLAEALEKVRKHLRADEGDIEVIDLRNNVLYIRLLGSCKQCVLVDMTQIGIKEIIKGYMPDIKDVVIVEDDR
ncbi:MAG: NifU family protein [Chlorobi bacterium]|nr:NifU family protein [Chlorobiota bacterium]